MKKRYTKEGIQAASATYRVNVNSIGEKFGIEVEHTKYPSQDFQRALDVLNQKQRDEINSSTETTAEEWYKTGAKRGILEFMRYIWEGKITVEKDQQGEITFYTDESDVSWKMGLRVFKDEKAVSKKYKVSINNTVAD